MARNLYHPIPTSLKFTSPGISGVGGALAWMNLQVPLWGASDDDDDASPAPAGNATRRRLQRSPAIEGERRAGGAGGQ